MKRLSLLLVPGLLIFGFACSHQPTQVDLPRATTSAPPVYSELLARYATPGGVRYDKWHANPADRAALESVVEFYASTLPPEDRDASLAWHLNAYNAWILHEILEKYPTVGPLEGDEGFFQDERITISGKETSFDQLEKVSISLVFEEPRIHFALNCASESCPPLHVEPFAAETLEADLDRLTREFINENPQGVVAGSGEVRLSKVFEWYAKDFGGPDAVMAFVNRYRNAPISEDADIRFLEYSWNLNAAN